MQVSEYFITKPNKVTEINTDASVPIYIAAYCIGKVELLFFYDFNVNLVPLGLSSGVPSIIYHEQKWHLERYLTLKYSNSQIEHLICCLIRSFTSKLVKILAELYFDLTVRIFKKKYDILRSDFW